MEELLNSSGSAVQPAEGTRAKDASHAALADAEPFLAHTEALLASHHADLLRDAGVLSEGRALRAADVEKQPVPNESRNGHLPDGRPTGETRVPDRGPDAPPVPVPTAPLRVKPPLHPGARPKRGPSPAVAKEQRASSETNPPSTGRFCYECGGLFPVAEARSAHSAALDVPRYSHEGNSKVQIL